MGNVVLEVRSKLSEYFEDISNPSYEECREYARALEIKSFKQWGLKADKNLPKDIQSYLRRSGYDPRSAVFFGELPKVGRPRNIIVTADLGNGVSKAGNSLGGIISFASEITITQNYSQSVGGLFRSKDIRNQDKYCYYQVGAVKGFKRYDVKINPFQKYSKIELLPLLLIGCLTRMPKLLEQSELIDGKRIIKIDLNLLTLAETGTEAIKPHLEKYLDFGFEGIEYQIKINKLTAYREGTGSAYIANKHCKKHHKGTRQFVLLDCGGGTLSESYWSVGNKYKPKLISQTAYDAGILVLRRWFSKYAKTGDNRKIDLEVIESAFRRANHDGEKYVAKSKVVVDLGGLLAPAFQEWVRQNFLEDLFNRLTDSLDDGIPLYLCGGGFKNQALLHYFQNELFGDFQNQIHLIPNPEISNIEGLLRIRR